MKVILTTLIASSLIVFGGCNKTQKVKSSSQNDEARELELKIEVESDGKQLVLIVNSEGQVIDLRNNDSLMLHEYFDLAIHQISGVNDHLVKLLIDSEDSEMMKVIHVRRMSEHDGPEGMREMRGRTMSEHDDPEGMREMRGRTMIMHRGPEGMRGNPEWMREMHEMREMDAMREMRGRMMDMHGGPEWMRDRMMEMHGGPQDMRGEWVARQREMNRPEEIQFIQEIGMLREVSHHLDSPDAIALLGIRMLRDRLDAPTRLEALDTIIDEAPRGSVARNAAIILMIETHQELGNDEDATTAMIELVLSNSVWDYDDDDEEDD